ncbi:probable CDP-alcohol phosphatidyltransferase [Sulfurimonas denitrificans DSM 1251]|uniref:Probable CDP-alcohol phosphatidyltransferase n=1 Tax=Sulfurimonas denitrificans (strain ATCC 33889 / DSM 1251) TaxID=326298 RepID=Q30U99_SULDN|nr:DUF4395 domain-containing protein [Sulfurimonas denitrificans]ABB43432.1 probable CDP-alcohol phosphatidyltransferase [Sulfurimonas denitrificans DSM 1251]MDD3442904.1 DUF4395 domain-containing protein [Sulfurimonas denitrificans]
MKSCPINYKKADQNIMRILAGLVTLIGLLFILSSQILLLIILLYDFLVRIFDYKKISPLFHISSFFAKLAKLKKSEVDSGPKEFASKLGFLFVASAAIIFFLGYPLVAIVIMFLLVCCAFLEAAFGYCVGCQIYILLKKFVP